jgi:hypothetical protein
MFSRPISAEEIHPALWRATQLARGSVRVVETGYPALSAELPGGGWPLGGLVELLVPSPGVGEVRLLYPALNNMGQQPVALVQPPHTPNGQGWAHVGVSPARLLRLNPSSVSDTMWCAEQILRADCFGALLVWLNHVQAASLRRLHLAAQTSRTLFVLVRPDRTIHDASPATLRVSVRAAQDGLEVDIVKRRGPALAGPLAVAMHPTPVLLSPQTRPARHPFRVKVSEPVVEFAS